MIQIHVLSNKILDSRGMTLMELLVAMTVLLFVSLALMQTALISVDSNAKNVLRDEAVRLAEERMSELRNTDFNAAILNTGSMSNTVSASVRNISMNYIVNSTIAAPTNDVKRIDLSVNWTWKGENYTHSISSIIYEDLQ